MKDFRQLHSIRLFSVVAKNELFCFVFNRTLETVTELLDVQDLKNGKYLLDHRILRLEWVHAGGFGSSYPRSFPVNATFTESTGRRRKVIKELKDQIIRGFINGEF